MFQHCTYCNQSVDMSPGAPAHVHDPKVCRGCKRELPISAFPLWHSSCDGHRHTCHDCTRTAQQRNTAAQHARRAEQRKAQREDLRRHGFRWRKTDAGWRLRNVVTGEVVTLAEAEETIQRRQQEEDFDREMGHSAQPPF